MGDVRNDAQETGPEVQARQGREDVQYRELWLSVAAQLGLSNRAPADVLAKLGEVLTERNRMHQELADHAEQEGVDRTVPIPDLLRLVGQAFQDRHTLVQLVAKIRQELHQPMDATAEATLDAVRHVRTVVASSDFGKLADAVGMPMHGTTFGELLDVVQDLKARVGAGDGVAFAGAVRRALGMRQETTHQQVVQQIGELQLQTKTAHLLADRLDMDRRTGVAQLLERVTALKIEADTAREIYEPGDERPVMTMEQAEANRDARRGAVASVLELWRGREDLPAVDDLVALAEYLLSGDAGPARAAVEAMQRRARDRDAGIVDGARWTPGDQRG